MVGLTDAEFRAACAERLECLYILLRRRLDEMHLVLQRLHAACRGRDLTKARKLEDRLQHAWTKTLTTIAAIEGLNGKRDEAARRRLEHSERDAAPLFARVQELTAQVATVATHGQP
jgi:hypothetical protein